MVHVGQRSSVDGLDAAFYGDGIVLTNGIEVLHRASGVETVISGGEPIKTSSDWASICYDAKALRFGVGDEILSVRWTFTTSGTAIELEGDSDDALIVRLSDDFSALVDHRFVVQGTSSPTSEYRTGIFINADQD